MDNAREIIRMRINEALRFLVNHADQIDFDTVTEYRQGTLYWLAIFTGALEVF